MRRKKGRKDISRRVGRVGRGFTCDLLNVEGDWFATLVPNFDIVDTGSHLGSDRILPFYIFTVIIISQNKGMKFFDTLLGLFLPFLILRFRADKETGR